MSVSLRNANNNQFVLPSVASRAPSGRVVFIEDFRNPMPGVWNDGVGGGTRDTEITFGGLPSYRLDPQGQSWTGEANPGRTARTAGVVAKRRFHDNFSGRFGIEAWFRMTSTNLTSGAIPSISLYNRTGTQAHHGRVWLDPNGNNQPMVARILDGDATNTLSGTLGTGSAVYVAAVTSENQNGAGSHVYDPVSGRLDKAGGWHFVKLVIDLKIKKYVSVNLDGNVADISAYSLDTVDSTGFAGMHFSMEFCATTTTSPRYVNFARIVGTEE